MKPTFLSHFLTPILLFCGVATLPLQAQSYKDPTLSPEERTTDLLRRMTLEEKIAQIRHIHSWNIFDEQDLNETKLQEFVGDLCWGFVEGFPLTGESCHRHMRRIQEYMVKHTRLGIPVRSLARFGTRRLHHLPAEHRTGFHFQSGAGLPSCRRDIQRTALSRHLSDSGTMHRRGARFKMGACRRELRRRPFPEWHLRL